MDRQFVITPDPYHICGYTGHVPGYRHRCGGTFSRLSHRLYVNPCTNHSPNIVLTNLSQKKEAQPSPRKLDILNKRAKIVDTKFDYPMLVGYDGHVPKQRFQCGESYPFQALTAVSEFELEMRLKRCQRRALSTYDVPTCGKGFFKMSTGSRLASTTANRRPLELAATKLVGKVKEKCGGKEAEPYSKFTTPLFLDCYDKRKYHTRGYTGHIPLLHAHFGHDNKVVTHGALCQYLENRRRHQFKTWCKDSTIKRCPLPLAAYDDRSCPASIDYSIYNSIDGMIPTYAGHVPGYKYASGQRYSRLTSNAKNWLDIHRRGIQDPTLARAKPR